MAEADIGIPKIEFNSAVYESDARKYAILRNRFIMAVIAYFWVWVTYGQAQKYLHPRLAAVACAVMSAVIFTGCSRMQKQLATGSDRTTDKHLLGFMVVMVLLFAAIYPLTQMRIIGTGSDRQDALRVIDAAAMHHHYLYDQKTFLGFPVSPLPGAGILALPFYWISAVFTSNVLVQRGTIGLQNILWMGLFVAFCGRFFRHRITALYFLALMFLVSGLLPNDYLSGGDFNTNLIYILLGAYWVIKAGHHAGRTGQYLCALFFLGIALSSRPIYVVVVPIIAAYLAQRAGWKRAFAAVAIPTAVASAITLPYYFYDPARFAPLHNASWINLPPYLHAAVVLPFLGILVACSSFFVRLSIHRVMLMIGLAEAVMLAPPLWAFAIAHPLLNDLGIRCEYIAPAAVPIVMWLFYQLESAALDVRPMRAAEV